jgi:hypothetical protein
MPKRPSFNCPIADKRIIRAIATRALQEIQALAASGCTRLDVALNLTACHCNGMPLRLEAMLAADGIGFAHDVLGIRQNLNRATGKIGGHFVPSFARSFARKRAA